MVLSLLTGCFAQAADQVAQFRAFFAQTFPLAPGGFTTVRGAPVRFAKEEFAANLHVDPGMFADCQVHAFSGVWVDCALPQYDNLQTGPAADAIGRALPAGFRLWNTSLPASYHVVWVRSSDFMSVDLVQGFGDKRLHIWVQQLIAAPARPPILDAQDAPLPVFASAQPSQTLGNGFVVAEDGTHSYIVTVSTARPSGPLFVGRPIVSDYSRTVSASVVAFDDRTGMLLLSVARLPIRPTPLEGPLEQGQHVTSTRLWLCSYQQMIDAETCMRESDTGIVAVPHPREAEFVHTVEYQKFDAHGAALQDASTRRVVGISLGPNLLNGYGASVAVDAEGIHRFVAQSVPQAEIPAIEPAKPPPSPPERSVVARASRSIVRLRVFNVQKQHWDNGTGVVVGKSGDTSTIVTAAHVFPTPPPTGGYDVQVYSAHASTALSANVSGLNRQSDVATLAVKGLSLPAITLAQAVRAGETIGSLGFNDAEVNLFAGDEQPELAEGRIGTYDPAVNRLEYNLSTSYGFSGGPVFDLTTGSLVGLVHGEIQPGGYQAVDLRAINSALNRRVAPSPPAATAVQTMPSEARAFPSLVLIDCPHPMLPDHAHLTGVVVASDASKSYIVTAVDTCAMTAHVGGAMDRSYPMHAVAEDVVARVESMQNDFVSIALYVIDRGGLRPATLSAAPPGGKVSVLSFADSTVKQHAGARAVPPRLDESTLFAGQQLNANNGISDGGAIFDPGFSQLFGITYFNGQNISLGGRDKFGGMGPPPPPDTRVQYAVALAPAIERAIKFSVDDIPYHQVNPLPPVIPSDTFFAVMERPPEQRPIVDFEGIGSGIAVGTRGNRSFLMTALTPQQRTDVFIAVPNDDGAEQVPATVEAYDAGTMLALISVPAMQLTPPEFGARANPNEHIVLPYYFGCSWDPTRANQIDARHTHPLPQCRYQAWNGTVQSINASGYVDLAKLFGIIGMTYQGSPVMDARTLRVVAIANGFGSAIEVQKAIDFLHAHGWDVSGR